MSSNSSSPAPVAAESKQQASTSNNPSVSNTPEPAAPAATPAPHKSSTPFKVVHQHIPPAPADGIWTFDAVPCFPGEVIEYEIVKVPPMYEADKEKGELPVRFPKTFLKYDIRPKYIGSPHLIFLNPTNEAFYEESGNLPNPILRIWLLLNHGSWKREANTYVKKRLVEECRRRNIEIKALHPNHFDLMVSKDGFDGLVYKGVQLPLPDCVLTRVGANVGYFGLAVLRQLESLGVFIFNNARGVEISRDKLYTHQVLAGNGVPIPKTVLGKFPIEYEFIEKTFGYPVIVKRTSGSKGDFVWKCDNKEELIAFEQQMIEQDKKEKAQALGLLPPDSSKNSPNVRTASNPATPRTEFTLESAHAGAPSPAAHPSTTVAPSSHTSAATPLPHPPGASHSSPRPTVPPTAGHSPRPPVVAQTQGHPAAASPSPAPSHIASAASSSAPAPATLPASHSPSSAHPVASTTSSSAASASSSAGTSTSPLSAPPSTPSAAQPGGPPATGDSTALGATEEKPHVPKAKKVSDTEKAYIFQEFLANTKGRDIRAFIVGTRVVASMMRVAAQGQFKANVHQGGSVKTTKLQKRLENMVLKTARLCNLDIAGVDVLLDKDSYKICEVNSSPGFEGLERATAVNVGHEIIEYICNTMEQKGRTRKAITLEAVPLQEEHLDEDGHHAAAATPAADGPANAASASSAVSPAAPVPSGSTGAAGSLTSTPPPAAAAAQPQSSQKS